MKFTDLQNKNIAELQELLKEARIKLGKFRFELANKALKDSSQIGKVKKEIARVMTALNEKVGNNK
ncbi:MAG: 50S ribosomal protein L29 [Patescibacteria group bacterium]